MVFLTQIESGIVELEHGIFISTEMGGVLSDKIKDGSLTFSKDLFPVRLPFQDRSSVFYGSTDHIVVDKKKWIDYGLPLQYKGENLTDKKIIVFPMHGLGDQLYLAVTIRNLEMLYPGVHVTIVKPSLTSAEQWYRFIYFDEFYSIDGPVISVDQMSGFDYFVDVEHFAHLPGYNGTYPPLFYMEHLFCHGPDCIKHKRPEINQDVVSTLKNGIIDKKLDELRKSGKPIVFINPVSTGRVRDIPEKTLLQFIEIARFKYNLIISTFKNSALEKKLDILRDHSVTGTGSLLSNVSDLIYLLGKIDFIITSDSGITHLGECFSVPCGSVFNVVTAEERTGPYLFNEDLVVEFEIPGVCKTPCYIHALKDDAECPGMKYMNNNSDEKLFWRYPPCLENLLGEHLYQLLESLNQAHGINSRNTTHDSDDAHAHEFKGEMENAIAKKSNDSEGFYNRGNDYLSQGKIEKAIEAFQGAIKHDPLNADALYNLGLVFQNLDQLQDAANCYEKVLSVNDSDVMALKNLAIVYHGLGKNEKAIEYCQKTLTLKPEDASLHSNMGAILQDLSLFDQAKECYRESLRLDPDNAKACYNMGHVLQRQNEIIDSISWYERALDLEPVYVMALKNLATVCHWLGRNEQAIEYCQKAIILSPEDASLHSNIGAIFQNIGLYDQAEEFHRESLRLDPDNFMTCYNIGNVLQRRNKIEDSIVWYEKALDLKPDYDQALNNVFHCYQHICDWDKMLIVNQKLDMLINNKSSNRSSFVELPFVNLTRCEDPLINYEIAKFWSDDVAYRMSRLNIEFRFKKDKPGQNKIIIGYLSNNFRDHPNAHLIVGLLEKHNRELFQINCYSYGDDDKSYYRQRIEAGCDNFIDIKDLSFEDAAKKIFDDGVGILIDLIGLTGAGKMEICAFRPAPIQVRYLGFPGSTGSSFIDYIITDETMTPKDHQAFYSEKFVYMPHCYQVNDDKQITSDRVWEKTDFDLPENGFVFCSFSTSYKIDPVIFDSWMRILKNVPGSVLWLLKQSNIITENLRKEAESRGVSGSRLVFSNKLKKPEHLARLKLADLALDTRIVTGHITTSDVLWAGVPLMTLMGKRFISRAPSSILKNIGLPELITYSLEEYEALAVELATHPDKLTYIKGKLKKNRLSEPLFNTSLFTRNYESGLIEMWDIYMNGGDPKIIEIDKSDK